MKKGDLSVTTIIVIALGLLVLIVLAILIFRSGSNADTSTTCITKGGVCKTTPCPDYEIPSASDACKGGYCCSPVKNTAS